MDEIVWAVNPQNDNLNRLADYLCQMADECFAEIAVRMRKEVPLQLPAYPIRAEVRHDLTLAVKEAFANLLKHAHAREARLQLAWQEPDLEIVVADDGQGFQPGKGGSGNGLTNQGVRMKRIGGTVELTSRPGQGTRLVFRVRLTSSG